MTTLYSWQNASCTLQQALQAISGEFIGYCISPQVFRFARCVSGVIETAAPLALDQVYEARFCNANLALRWLRDAAGQGEGTAVLLAEDQACQPADWNALSRLDGLTELDGDRVLTGVLGGDADKPGWRLMNAPRHGVLAIPLTVEASDKSRVAWRGREYIGLAPGRAGEDGNRMVVEERMLGLVIIKGEK